MRVLVYPHDLAIGGSQINAIDLAAAVQRAGHDVAVFGRSGALVDRIAELGLEFIPSPDPGRRPSRRIASLLRNLAETDSFDVVHGYEWPPALESYWSTRRGGKCVAVATVMSMSVAPFIPKSLPLLVGTEQIAAFERAGGRSTVGLLEPPVDVVDNDAVTPVEIDAFRHKWSITADVPAVVCVTRFASQLKLEGIIAAIQATVEINKLTRIRLLLVGDGPEERRISQLADRANRECGPGTVVMTGRLDDPRPAYQVADVALGMGGSALRAMACSKPLIVQGENGFWELMDSASVGRFLWTGWYGRGTGAEAGCDRLVTLLSKLLAAPDLMQQLGEQGRSLVENRFSLDVALDKQLEFYDRAISMKTTLVRKTLDLGLATLSFASYYLKKKALRALGRTSTDDFNARPLAARVVEPVSSIVRAMPGTTGGVVYLAGVSWDAIVGSDRQLVTELAHVRPVLWVDPPMSLSARRRRGVRTPRLSLPVEGVVRLNTVTLPGVSKPVLRALARWTTFANVKLQLNRSNQSYTSVLASTIEPTLAQWRGSRMYKVYYATDDFVAGAGLLGLTAARAERSMRSNLKSADLVLAVTAELAQALSDGDGAAVVFGNACSPTPGPAPAPGERLSVPLPAPIAILVGQLNDRLSLDMLEEVADRNVSLLLVGPRYEEDVRTASRLDELIKRPNVHWTGRIPFEDVAAYLAVAKVGLTPYVDDAFNRASFPLKTLEYLAAGLPVVSTDLPYALALGTDQIALAHDAASFAGLTEIALASVDTDEDQRGRVSVAMAHSWTSRAHQLDDLLP